MKRRLLAGILAAGVLLGCSSADSGTADPTWEKFTPEFGLAGKTAEPVPVEGALPDGQYWGTLRVVLGTDTIVFELMQARFGETCEQWATDNGMAEGCPNDYWVDDSVSQIVSADDVPSVSVAEQSGPGTSYRINGTTLERLARNDDVNMPDGYLWTNFPFIVTIEGGRIVSADQFWVP